MPASRPRRARREPYGAQRYTMAADVSERVAANSRPPFASIHRNWWSNRKSVARPGVLYVWSRREFSTAIERSSVGGIQRPLAFNLSMREIAAGEQSAS